MDNNILLQKHDQVMKELSQMTKAISALSKKYDELIGQKAMLEELLRTEVPQTKTPIKTPKAKTPKKKSGGKGRNK